MRRVFVVFLFLAVAVTIGASSPAMAAPISSHVIILSLDGGKPAVIEQSEMPTLKAEAKAGAATWNAQTVFPSITLVSHTSMLAGVGPEKHKVNWNSWIEAKGKFAFPTVFTIAKQAGLGTALYAGKDKFLHFDAPGALDEFAIPGNKAPVIAEAAAKYYGEKKPSLMFVHFPDPDSAGHKFGWGSPEQIHAFAESDAGLKILVDGVEAAGLKDDTTFIISADHGGHDRTHGSNSPEDMTIPWITFGKAVKPGFTITDPVTTYDTAATALYLLGIEIPKDWDGKPVVSAYESGQK